MQPLMEPAQSPGPPNGPPSSAANTSGLVFEARLVHAEPGRRVVEASAWRRGECLGRCLGEGEEAEAAEDRALARLHHSLANQPVPAEPTRASTLVRRPPSATPAAPAPAVQTAAAPPQPDHQGPEHQPPPPEPNAPPVGAEPPTDPEDWSDELAELDVQLQRLGWDRSQEGRYLERAFGHPSRSRLTAYADLLAYLKSLRALSQGSQPEQAPVPLRRRDLLSQSDQLLSQLGWDAGRGRGLLEQHFQLSSRQQLSDEQLLHFNMLLEGELINAG